MATAPIAERDPLAGIATALNLFSGKTSTTTSAPSTTTTKSNISPDQLNALIQEAMAPANIASHAAGMYGDTSLAMQRAQLAATTAAKYAGQTTTQSGGSQTQKVSAPLGGLNSALGPILAASSASNLVKKLTGFDATDKLATGLKRFLPSPEASTGGTNLFESEAADYLSGLGAEASGGVSAAADAVGEGINLFAGDAANYLAELGLDLGSEAVSSAAVDAGTAAADSGVFDTIADTVSSTAGDIADWFGSFFAEGGLVKKKGYAVGGLVKPDAGLLVNNSSASSGADSSSDLLEIIKSTGGSSDISGQSATAETAGSALGSVAKGATLADVGIANLGLTALGLTGPLGALASRGITAATGVPNVMSMLANTLTAMPGEADPTAAAQVNALDAMLAMNDFFGTAPESPAESFGGGSSGLGTDGFGGSSGDSAAAAAGAGPGGPGEGGGDSSGDSSSSGMATGGQVSGPGTGTSDSIEAMLSDGEYVIDAKTVEALGPEFFQKIQAMFNPAAIASQAKKGRI